MRKTRLSRTHGFTIVELLIVIVVIAILAAITIVAYNGVQKSAVEATIKSDVENSVKQIESDQITNGTYTASPTGVNTTGIRVSGSNTYIYSVQPYGYCIGVSSTTANALPYYFSSKTRTLTQGRCEATVSTFAGSGTYGSTDGTGAGAQFSWPGKMAIAPDGTMYVAEIASPYRIRKITTGGVVSTLTSTTFNNIGGMAIGPDGLLYVSDVNNRRIRTVNTTSGAISIFAGSGVAGSVEGTGTGAQFNSPQGLVFDSTGNLYVVDSNNYRIRKITPGGVTSNFAGLSYGYADGTGTAAQFGASEGIAIDGSDNLYLADSENQRIRKITPGQVVTTHAGSGTWGAGDGVGAAAQFKDPVAIYSDALGTMYVLELNGHNVRKISPDRTVITLSGAGSSGFADGVGSVVRYNSPRGVVINASTGNVYIGDYGNNRIREIVQP